MGRFVSGAGSDQPRKKTIKLFASDPAVPVPAWAGVVYVTGCGGGGGGGNTSSAGNLRGAGGGASAFSSRAPIPVPSGLATVQVIIGAAGVGAAGGSNAAGTDGGKSTVTVGQQITLFGGGGGPSLITSGTKGGLGGVPVVGGALGRTVVNESQINGEGFFGPASPMSAGAPGGLSNDGAGGGISIFGAGGLEIKGVVAPGTSGADGTGYGAGGSGGRDGGRGGNGSPGFIMLEFEETA